jgi:hypothetical protein
MRAEQA